MQSQQRQAGTAVAAIIASGLGLFFGTGVASGLVADVHRANSGVSRRSAAFTRMDVCYRFSHLATGWPQHVELLPRDPRDSSDSGNTVQLGTGAGLRLRSAGVSAFLATLGMAGSANLKGQPLRFSSSEGQLRLARDPGKPAKLGRVSQRCFSRWNEG